MTEGARVRLSDDALKAKILLRRDRVTVRGTVVRQCRDGSWMVRWDGRSTAQSYAQKWLTETNGNAQ